ncbi:YfcL family protein [Shewanella avicenniae]|uniref:YfcL family protein n=1 Tax=Shewanella avicenniae TaxID=2814294 RepID=A0ABX7QWE3_9GAMM|nr:YfcL family protein [Shewanella avicenniae]QSX34970.1 YfcL family protein [Shewanella avicenniae]
MLEQYDLQLEQWIGEIVAKGDDDALFASGYLQGHFAVVLAELEAEDDHSAAALAEKMQQCLKLAAKELEDHDYRLVADAWQELQQRLSA